MEAKNENVCRNLKRLIHVRGSIQNHCIMLNLNSIFSEIEAKNNEPEFLTAGNQISEQCKLSKGKYEMNITHNDYLA